MMTKDKLNRKDKKIYNKTRKYLEKIDDLEIDNKMETTLSILKIEDKEKRYSKLYDLICDYLDNEFRSKNLCGFNCGICKRRKDMISRNIKKETYENGCCYSYLNKKCCENLDPKKGCQIKNIACKTYTCYYLKKQGYHYKLKNLYLARYFFNNRQIFYMENTFFVDKPVVMQGIMKRG